jgi:NACHT domain
MLAEVRRVWIDGYLKDSLHNLLRIELGLQEKPDALGRPWDLIVQRPDREPRPLPPGRSMAAVFDEMGRRLLILGAPGSGKTTLLLELADHLLDLAKHDEKHPIPVVFHLSTWAARRQPLKDWLVDELWKRYDVARKIGQAWVNGERILPLLDGLDEVAPEHREACVEAINAFRREHPLVAFAVCSRAAEYEELRVRLELSGAVLIRPLSREQIGAYLKEAGKSLAGVRTVLRDDETVWDLLETPLMLSIVALTYQGRSASEIRATGTLEQRRTDLFANYTERMFERRCKVTAYTREQTVRWLTWLARSMIKNNLSVFYLEWMQPDWLAFRGQRWLLVMAASMCTGLAYGLIVLLPILISLLTRDALFVELSLWLFGGLMSALVLGCVFALLYGVGVRLDAIDPMGLSIARRSGEILLCWLGGWVSVTTVPLIVADTKPPDFGPLLIRLGDGALAAVVLGSASLAVLMLMDLVIHRLHFLAKRLVSGVTVDEISAWAVPKQGVARSIRDAIMGFLAGFIPLMMLLIPEHPSSPIVSLDIALFIGLLFGLLFALRFGGFSVIKHYVLRFLLRRNGYSPLNYVRFLDYAAERVFLRKVGGGYVFTHRLLMEYFATLRPKDGARQIRTS